MPTAPSKPITYAIALRADLGVREAA